MALEILKREGKDDRRRPLVLVRCTCGREKVLREDKARQQASCGQCERPRKVGQQDHLQAPHGTPEWYTSAIASLTQAAERLESQAREFEAGIKSGGIEAAGEEANDRLWHRAVTSAAKMRAEIARLDKEMREREVGIPAVKRPTFSMLTTSR